jgi:hypothetical protein
VHGFAQVRRGLGGVGLDLPGGPGRGFGIGSGGLLNLLGGHRDLEQQLSRGVVELLGDALAVLLDRELSRPVGACGGDDQRGEGGAELVHQQRGPRRHSPSAHARVHHPDPVPPELDRHGGQPADVVGDEHLDEVVEVLGVGGAVAGGGRHAAFQRAPAQPHTAGKSDPGQRRGTASTRFRTSSIDFTV